MTNKFKVGDKAKITGNTNSHKFKIGEIVILDEFNVATWRCYDLDRRDYWYVKESEMEPYEQPLTLQQKFEQGWEMKYKHMRNPVVTEMRTTQNGKIVAFYSDGDVAVWYIYEFEENHTITHPSSKMEKKFTPIYEYCDMFQSDKTFETIEDAVIETIEDAVRSKEYCHVTTILEHEKQGEKWVFVKAHEV